ncbi:hypothetical protein TNCV_4512411 [Trichonephila clavipes]|nr:hypothetical protein TNCV_4512411 [Trichonephila clavipes]
MKFSLSADYHRTRVGGAPASGPIRHLLSSGIQQFTRCDSVGSNFLGQRSSLVVLQGTLTARRYVDDILTPIVLPMLSSHPGAIYQQDNARLLRDSPNNVFKLTYHGLGHQIFRQ